MRHEVLLSYYSKLDKCKGYVNLNAPISFWNVVQYAYQYLVAALLNFFPS